MQQASWMIYGAYGVTGKIIVQRAVKLGLKPVLAGRNPLELEKMAQEYALDWRNFDLADKGATTAALQGQQILLNCAGPFEKTAPILVEACLKSGTHYLDISNEIVVFEKLLTYDQAAKKHNIIIIPGVGYGTVATNFLAKELAEQLPGATQLEIATASYNAHSSAGVAATILEVLRAGAAIYKDGQLTSVRLGSGGQKLAFPDGLKSLLITPLGDLVAAQQVTKIPNVKVYTPTNLSSFSRRLLPLVQLFLKNKLLRNFIAQRLAKMEFKSKPVEPAKHSYSWAKVTDAQGRSLENWLIMGEGYDFTAQSSLAAIQFLLTAQTVKGVQMPAEVFPATFLTELDNVTMTSNFQVASALI